jgi:tripartite-type tricarboxylate transporter receptor subunit TctC
VVENWARTEHGCVMSVSGHKFLRWLYFATLLVIFHAGDVPAQGNFYQGKSITVVVGSAPGGLYDLWARLLARTMGKYIPGNPNMLVQNMPGAGSVVAANYLYGVAKPDGLTIGMFQTHLYLLQMVGQSEVKFDVRRLNWLGSQEKGQMMLYVRADSPFKSIDDIVKANEPPKCGGSGTADQTALLTRLLEETVGAKFTRVLGYKGGSEVDLAMERGEVVCRATRITVHFSREPFLSWDKKGFDRHIVQAGNKRDARLPEVPTIFELMDKYKTPEVGRRLARVVLAGDELGRPMVAPPGVPADRVKILRDAYAKALRDADLIAEVSRSRLDMEPSTGEEIQALYKELMAQPREVVERVKKLDEH